MRALRLLTAVMLVAALSPLPAAGQDLPGPLQGVSFEQHLGERVPLDAPFVDHTGASAPLGDYLGQRPVVLALVYFDCPMLCSMVLNGLTQSLRTLEFDAGREFDVAVVSFDSRESAGEAAAARAATLERYGRDGSEGGWHFLTGSADSVARLTDSVGFSFVYDEATGEFAHAAGLVVLTPEGRIARYFYGVEYAPRDLRLGLIEAADGTIGGLVDQVLLYCFRYDPTTGKYSAVALNMVRLGGALTVLAIGGFLMVSWRRERRTHPA